MKDTKVFLAACIEYFCAIVFMIELRIVLKIQFTEKWMDIDAKLMEFADTLLIAFDLWMFSLHIMFRKAINATTKVTY